MSIQNFTHRYREPIIKNPNAIDPFNINSNSTSQQLPKQRIKGLNELNKKLILEMIQCGGVIPNGWNDQIFDYLVSEYSATAQVLGALESEQLSFQDFLNGVTSVERSS